jgi:hypothetical protein
VELGEPVDKFFGYLGRIGRLERLFVSWSLLLIAVLYTVTSIMTAPIGGQPPGATAAAGSATVTVVTTYVVTNAPSDPGTNVAVISTVLVSVGPTRSSGDDVEALASRHGALSALFLAVKFISWTWIAVAALAITEALGYSLASFAAQRKTLPTVAPAPSPIAPAAPAPAPAAPVGPTAPANPKPLTGPIATPPTNAAPASPTDGLATGTPGTPPTAPPDA